MPWDYRPQEPYDGNELRAEVGARCLEAEQAVLGACLLLGEDALGPLIEEHGLGPECFYRPQHGVIFAAMLELHRLGAPVDTLTVLDRLRSTGRLEQIPGGKAGVDELAAAPPVAHNAAYYGSIVLREHRWREREEAAYRMLDAIERRDEDAFQEATP